ncbi:MAG: HD domain-containing phosphohydrolase [Thermomicrobiales bacterium]
MWLLDKWRTRGAKREAALSPPVEAVETVEQPAPQAVAPALRWQALLTATRQIARGGDSAALLEQLTTAALRATGATHALLWATVAPPRSWRLLTWQGPATWQPDSERLTTETRPLLARLAETLAPLVIADESPDAWLIRDWRAQGGWAVFQPVMVEDTLQGVLAVSIPSAALLGDDERQALAVLAPLVGMARAQQAAQQTPLAPADPFSSLPDRKAMIARLEGEIARARRFGQPLSLALFDLDRFGAYVSSAGAAAASATVQHFTTVLQSAIRDTDVLGRGDDDDFILILPMSASGDAFRTAERLRELTSKAPPEGALETTSVTMSGSVVSYPADGESAEALLDAAARTVTYAKRMGRNQVRVRGLGDIETPASTNEREGAGNAPDNEQLHLAFGGLIDALSIAGDQHDRARPGHSRAVAQHARALAESCGLDPDRVRTIELAGMLHDVGKIGLPDEILGKQDALTLEELAILRGQPSVGTLIIAQIPSLESVIPLVKHAQEWFDGNGYPGGLRGAQIPLGSRIISIAEGYEAMVSDRPYRSALSRSMAVAELWRAAGARYDPQLVDTFVRLVTHDTPEMATGWDPARLERMLITDPPESAADQSEPAADPAADDEAGETDPELSMLAETEELAVTQLSATNGYRHPDEFSSQHLPLIKI